MSKNKTRWQRLEDWVETLSPEQMKHIIMYSVDYCIDAEEVSFYDSSKRPYWSNSGDSLDGVVDDNK